METWGLQLTNRDKDFYAARNRAFDEIAAALEVRAKTLGFTLRPSTVKGRPFGSRQVTWDRDAEMMSLCLEGRDEYLSLAYSLNRNLRSPLDPGFVMLQLSTSPKTYDGKFPQDFVARFRSAIEDFSPAPSI